MARKNHRPRLTARLLTATLAPMFSDFLHALLRLAEPVGWVWLGLLALTLRPLIRTPRRPDSLAITLFILWSLAVCTTLPTRLIVGLEKDWHAVSLSDLSPCDAIVLLGGGSNPAPAEPAGVEIREAGDRLATALHAATTLPTLPMVFGGGEYSHEGHDRPAADGLRDWFQQLGTFRQPAYSLGFCQNTHDEALKTASLCQEHGWTRVLLITSAYHMNRSQAVFEKAGVQVACLPCNFYRPGLDSKNGIERWVHLPGNAGLTHFSYWFHEIVGHQVYRLRGWID